MLLMGIWDGNMHVTLYIEKDIPDWHSIIEGARLEVYEVVKKLEGNLPENTARPMSEQCVPSFLDEAQIDLIRRVKLAFDPNNILNPGKIVPWE